MKEKIFKKSICILVIICMLAMIFAPNFVKSAQIVVSNMSNTGRGIGDTSIFTVQINGYSNLYCVRGGATLTTGMQLNDNGVSLYTTTGKVVRDSSAIQWLLDNMYLTEGTDESTQKAMRQNLINIMKKYNTYKDSNGNSILNKKLNVNGINDEWITKAVDDVLNDKTTLYAVQQYVIWNHVENTYDTYYNTMQNSDGSYNAIPGAKASRVHYTALYITLNELAAEAQKNGYKSPNNSGHGFDIKIEKQSNTKATISSDGKSVLAGPYKLKNNHGLVKKSFSATINSDKADKVETVNAEGKGVNVLETQGEFYVKITYNKGFVKGTEYKIGINVGLSGYRTFATLLDTSNAKNQPLVTIRKEAINTNMKTEINVKEELKGEYRLVLEKISEGEKISGVTFKVKEGIGEAKPYGPTNSDGYVKIVDKKIEQEGIDEYAITEIDVGTNKLVKVQDEIKFYVTKANVDGKYVVSKVSLEKDREVKEKVVKLEDGTDATVRASVSGNTVKVTIPNKPKEEPKGDYSLVLEKISEGEKISGVTFKVKEGSGEAKTYGPTDSNGKVKIFDKKDIKQEGIDEYTITEIDVGTNKLVKVQDEIKIYVTKANVDGKYVVSKVSFEKDREVKEKVVKLEDGTDATVIISKNGNIVKVTIPNKPKEEPKGDYSLVLEKISEGEKISGVTFKVKEGSKEAKTYGPTDSNGKVKIFDKKDIKQEGIDEYTITEIDVGTNKLVKVQDEIKFYVTKANVDGKYVVSKVSFEKDREVKEKVVKLEDGTNATVIISKNGNIVKVIIPNKPVQKDFDLALRKFITGVNDREVTNRIPVFKIDEKGNYVYNHDKEPVLVANSNIVTYTLRVYNEGEVAGYAKEIKDDIPNGLEFIPDNELNKEYRWIMLDKYGKETDNVAEAKYITTDYLSKEQEKTAGSNLLKPFDEKAYEAGSIKEPDYKEVKVAFKVNMPDKSEEIIINKAEISDDSDENGKEVTDKDSTPNEWIDGEDDQDIEKIKIQYFDLALRKWVTKAIVTENGVEKVYETGHKAEDDPEAVVKVDLKKSDINKVTVKFEYKIRIENQGKIAGYAKEISDYIPEGLKFVKEDNPLWKEVEGKVVTEQLKDTLLGPGETAEVSILLTWINREDNMGLKVNVAEISKDYNEYGAPDIDSTPNNKVPGEDDIDVAPVMLTVTTGEEPVYIILTISIFGILAVGLVGIKKFVL